MAGGLGSKGLSGIPTGLGETNTSSNVGTGSGIFKQKTGVDFELRKILAGTGISVAIVSDDVVITLGSHSHIIGDVTGLQAALDAKAASSHSHVYADLTLTNGIVNADVNAAAAIAYSKLSLTGAILNADLAGSIAYSKLSLTGAILNADLAGSIALSKLATDPLARANHTGTQAASTISDLATVVKAYNLDEFAAAAAIVDCGAQALDNVKQIISEVDTITSGAAITINFDNAELAKITSLAHAPTFTTSNRAAGKKKRILIVSDATPRALTFSESWKWLTAVPTTTAASKNSVLTLECLGTATTDVWASWVEQP